MTGGEAPAGRANAGAHHRRPRALHGFGFGVTARGLKVLAGEIKLALACPQRLDEAHPLVGHGIARSVRQLGFAKHRHFVAIPACDHVQPETAARNMVDRRALLGGHHRMHRGDGGGGKDVDVGGGLRDPGGPGPGFEAAVIELAGPAKSFPATDRNDRLQTQPVGGLRDSQRFGPLNRNAAGSGGNGAAVADVAAKHGQLETIGAEGHAETPVPEHQSGARA